MSMPERAVRRGLPKGGQPAVVIVIDDDDDDVPVLWRPSQPQTPLLPLPLPPPYPPVDVQERYCTGPSGHLSLHVPFLEDGDLELRLGQAGHGSANSRSSLSMDFTSSDCVSGERQEHTRKRKQLATPLPAKDLKLTCPICMGTMEEETSTTCGHIFCKTCITTSLLHQKKCPTCRKKLGNRQIHRIYLSGSTL